LVSPTTGDDVQDVPPSRESPPQSRESPPRYRESPPLPDDSEQSHVHADDDAGDDPDDHMLNNLESDVPEPLDGRQTLGVRKDPPASSDSHVTVKQPKYKSTSHASSRVRAGDFDNVTQKVLDAAIAEYRVVICTRDPFPDADYNQEISAQAWVNACVVGNIRIQPNEEIMKLVRSYFYIYSETD
jgi:hypothetical protein